MPLLEITASKKVTAIVTLEDATARQIDQYAAFTKGSADDVVEAALTYVFEKDKAFQKFRDESTGAKPTIALRMKRSVVAAKEGRQAFGRNEAEHSSPPVRLFRSRFRPWRSQAAFAFCTVDRN